MAHMLRRFYAEVRMRNGKPYGTSAMRNLRQAIQRHLTDPPFKRTISIINDIEFKQANIMFDSQIRNLRLQGLDKAKHKTNIEAEDMAKFTAAVSLHNPVGLQEAMFVAFMTHFGRRGREGLRMLQKDSIEFGVKGSIEFAEIRYNEATKCDDGTKKFQCGPVSKESQKKMWAELNDEKCPVKILKMYISKLNPKCNALFQRPNQNFKDPQNDRWYDNMVLGKQYLGRMMRTISEKYNLSNPYTNHCLRATVVTELDRAGFESKDICHVTGHHSSESLKHYCDKPSTDRSLEMSRTLHRFINQKQMGPGGDAQNLAPAQTQVPAPTQDPVPTQTPAPPQAPTEAPIQTPASAQAPTTQAHAPAPTQELNINTSEHVLHSLQGFFNNPVFHGNVTINLNINR